MTAATETSSSGLRARFGLEPATSSELTLVFPVRCGVRVVSDGLDRSKLWISCRLEFDGPGRDRTSDLGIKSPLLYQLSYRPAAGYRVRSGRRESEAHGGDR